MNKCACGHLKSLHVSGRGSCLAIASYDENGYILRCLCDEYAEQPDEQPIEKEAEREKDE